MTIAEGVAAFIVCSASCVRDDAIGREITQGPAYKPRAADVASLGASYVGRNLFAFYKATEDKMRASAYYAYRNQGKGAQEAAQNALARAEQALRGQTRKPRN